MNRANFANGLQAVGPLGRSTNELTIGLVAWMYKERGNTGGGSEPGPKWNPFDMTSQTPTATVWDHFRGTTGAIYTIWNYASVKVGWTVFWQNIHGGLYPNLSRILSTANSTATQLATALPDLNTWGTGIFPTVVTDVRANPSYYYNLPVTIPSTGTGGTTPVAPPTPTTPKTGPTTKPVLSKFTVVRHYPRDDHYGAGMVRQSTVRHGPTSRQKSFRQGPRGTYS